MLIDLNINERPPILSGLFTEEFCTNALIWATRGGFISQLVGHCVVAELATLWIVTSNSEAIPEIDREEGYLLRVDNFNLGYVNPYLRDTVGFFLPNSAIVELQANPFDTSSIVGVWARIYRHAEGLAIYKPAACSSRLQNPQTDVVY